MKKLLCKIGLLLVPILLYYGVFVAFEPNNYFGIKEKADGTNIMATLREFEATPENSIILGDSRTAKFDPAIIRAATGHSWANLSYGGASLTEQLDVLDWALGQNSGINEVLFMASFYTLNAGYNHDRMVIKALSNPLVYMTNLGYNINMLTNLRDHLAPGAAVGDEGETMEPADYRYVDYIDEDTGEVFEIREKIAEHLAGLATRSRSWALNEEGLERLLETITECEAAGIRFILVLPPAHGDVWEHIIMRYGIAEPMAEVLLQLHQSGALVLDYEFENQTLLADNQFYDGFHLDTKHGLPQWTQLLFEEIGAAGKEASFAS